MDRLKSTEHDYNINLWVGRIKECRASGSTVPVWCSQNGFGVKNYYYWLRKIKREALDSLPTEITPTLPALKTDAPVFSKVNVTNINATSAHIAVTIHFNGITVAIKDSTSEATIKNTFLAIRNICQVISHRHKTFILSVGTQICVNRSTDWLP